ncbi:hypothetical protein Tco_0250854 [Tanacetum coccineum]
MIPEPGDLYRDVPIPETFHEQTDDELIEQELKQVEVDYQAIQTILIGLPKDIYVVVNICETAQEIWLCVQQIMKGSDIGAQEKKSKLFNEWERFTSIDGESIESYYHQWKRHITIVHQTKNLHEVDYTQLYDFLKMNQEEVAQNVVQNVGNHNGLIVVPGIANLNVNQNGNGNVVAACAEGTDKSKITKIQSKSSKHGHENQKSSKRSQRSKAEARKAKPQSNPSMQNYESAAVRDLDEIEEVNANCILMANLQQASTSGTQTEKPLVYDSDGSAEQYTELLEPISEPHQVQQHNSSVISAMSSVEKNRGTVEQNPATVVETRALYDSLYHNLATVAEKVNMVNRKMKETNA